MLLYQVEKSKTVFNLPHRHGNASFYDQNVESWPHPTQLRQKLPDWQPTLSKKTNSVDPQEPTFEQNVVYAKNFQAKRFLYMENVCAGHAKNLAPTN